MYDEQFLEIPALWARARSNSVLEFVVARDSFLLTTTLSLSIADPMLGLATWDLMAQEMLEKRLLKGFRDLVDSHRLGCPLGTVSSFGADVWKVA
jgi:hypothetical protein